MPTAAPRAPSGRRAPTPGPLTVLGVRLPQGRELATADVAWRHRLVCRLVAVHLPVLGVLAALRGRALPPILLELAGIALLLGVGMLPGSRTRRTGATTLALLSCSALVVELCDLRTEAHVHYFIAVAVLALYQDWLVYLLAVAFVGVQHVLGGTVAGWGWAALHATAVLAEAAVLVVFWQATEAARADSEAARADSRAARADSDRLRSALADGETTVQARLEETERIRTDLIGTVSHEFRTPLTGIRAAALTLLKRGDRLDPAGRAQLLHAVLDQQERLSRLLENMLTAARATPTDPAASARVEAVAAEVAMLAGASRPRCPPVSVLVEPGTAARIDRQALHQVLANLVDNAQQHGADGAVPLVAAGRDERGVWLTVSNEGTTLDSETARRLFEPFAQADSGSRRQHEGIGMGLYVVRRLVEVHGGSVALRSEGGWTTVELRLAAAGQIPPVPEPRSGAGTVPCAPDPGQE